MGDSSSSAQVACPPTRKLVSVRQISKIDQLAGCHLVVIHVDGWKVVIPRRPPMYQVGELVVYFEIDSFIPKTGHFWELFSQPGSSEWFRGKDGHRVKSTRIHSQVSQGLIYPLGNFPEITGPFEARVEEIGREGATEELLAKSFADLLGVVKWEFTETAETLPSLGPPPAFIRMPAWHRIQDVERFMFSRKSRQKTWQITEKLDCATMTVYKIANDSRWAASLPALPANSPITMHDNKNRYGVCSRKEDLIHRPGNLYWQTAMGSGLLAKIRHFPRPNIAVQGELCGSSIGDNTMQYPEGEHEFLVFAIWDIDKGTYVRPKEVEELCGQFGIQHVPVVAYCSLADFARDLDELLSKAEGKGKFGGVREGLVFRSTDMDAFKVISNSWLSLTGK